MDADSRALTVSSEVKYSGIQPGEPIIFRAQSGGINIKFQSSIIQVGGNALSMRLFSNCRIEFPESITVNQLRSAVRVNFSNLANVPVTYLKDRGSLLQGTVQDLSTSGAKISFKGNLKYQFKEDQIIADCQMMIPTQAVVKARIKVLGFVYDEKQDVSYIRCQFLEMDQDSALHVKQLIEQSLRDISVGAVA